MEIETGRDRAAERRARSPAARAATWLLANLVRLEPRVEAALGTRAWVPLSVLVALTGR